MRTSRKRKELSTNTSLISQMTWGYIILILLAMAQEILVFFNIYASHTYSLLEISLNIVAMFALLFGFIVSIGIAVVVIFIFLVTYFVWMVTYAPVNTLVFFELFLIPANILIAAFIKSTLIRNKRVSERLEALRKRDPEVDLYTSLGNKKALGDTVVKQSNLARRYSERYTFSMAMFKIEFLALVQESLGSQLYSQLLLELSETIQKQIRYEDYKFSIEDGRFIILCPMTDQQYLQLLTDRIKNAMMDMKFLDKKGNDLKLVIRAGAFVFQKEQFSTYEHIDEIIAALERNTETDLIAEYI
ncbi:GGDEF domain-containing protein [Paenibacillus nicotianae]|uniref:GGDEF domain-containing protein n=1 Tax=Paenibacillus nicotianae TaxID=1526551 RepID=A0ABW4V1E7_9BACL